MISLVLGGNKSGKSKFGEQLLAQSPLPHAVVATGKAGDLAFRRQIQAHRLSRDAAIGVHEVDLDLLPALQRLAEAGGGILLDSLDFWLFARCQRHPNPVEQDSAHCELVDGLRAWRGGPLIIISTEMGLGPLAPSSEVRAFVRAMGQLNQEIASISEKVYAIVAGLPLQLK